MDTKKATQEKEIANDMTSSMLIHPGEMIKDEIIARGITQKELAKQMGVSYTVFNEILNGKRPNAFISCKGTKDFPESQRICVLLASFMLWQTDSG